MLKITLFKLNFSIPIFILTVLLAPSRAVSQDDGLGGWHIYFGNIAVPDSRFSIDAEAQWRNHEFASDLQQLLLRGGVKYQATESLSLVMGYGFIQTENVGEPDLPFRENRIYQEANLVQKTWRLNFRHRFRYEQRFVEGRDFNTRYRYCLSLDIPLNNAELESRTVYASFYNEIFIHGQKTADSRAVFDRNRIYLGAGYRFTKSLALQAGWMNQVLENSAKAQVVLSVHHKMSF